MIMFLLCIIISVEFDNKFEDAKIDDIVFKLKMPVQAEDAEKWVKQLGDDRFSKREQAANILKKMDVKACVALKANIDNEDPEIKFRSRFILRNIREVYPSGENDFPNIWDMPNCLRFIEEERDIAKEYYIKVFWQWAEEEKIKNATFAVKGVNYGDYKISRKATILYIGDMREKGLAEEYAVRLLDKMHWNNKYLHHVIWKHRDDNMVPSCLLKEPVREGVPKERAHDTFSNRINTDGINFFRMFN